MSTKTNFKRIALVAVAALGMGVLSSVPSQATIVGTPTVTAVNGTAGVTGQTSDSTTAATLAVRYYTTSASDSAQVTFSLGVNPGTAGGTDSLLVGVVDTASSTGVTLVKTGSAGGTAIGFTDSVTAASNTFVSYGTANSFVSTKYRVQLDSGLARVAGTYTVNYTVKFFPTSTTVGHPEDTTKTTAGTFDIVVSNGTLAAAGAVTASGTSTAVMTASGTGTGDDSGVKAVMTPTGVAIGTLSITQKTSAGLFSRESITVTSTIGNIGLTSASAGKSMTIIADADGVTDLSIFADGTSGSSVITVKTTSVTFSNKTVVFYSTSVNTITAVQLGKTLGGTASAIIAAVASDAAGNQIIADSSVYAYSSDLTVINTGATTGTECTYNSDLEVHVCALSGANDGTATITLRNKSTVALSTKASSAVSVVVNTKAPVSLKLAFDKATYAPGEAAYISLWAVDASGKPVAPAVARTNLLASGGITSTVAFGNGTNTDSLTANSVSPTFGFTTKAGRGFASQEPIYLAKVFMPASGGAVTISATGGALLPLSGQVAVTATATVTDSAAAALAAVTALATTVASLKTLITTLTNLVLKIQKKVKA